MRLGFHFHRQQFTHFEKFEFTSDIFIDGLLPVGVLVYHLFGSCLLYRELVFISLCFQLVGRFSQEELLAQLPSFLPALLDAFGSQIVDVRKVCDFYFSFLDIWT